MMWVLYQIQLPTKKPLLVLNPTSGSIAMKDVMTSMPQNKLWSLVDLPDDCRPIG